MKKITLNICAIFIVAFASAQNTFPASGSAGIGTTTPDASSAVEIKSTTQGILIPRMKKTQRDAIVSPVEGLMIYQTTASPGFYYYDGSNWKAVAAKGVNKTLSNLTAPTAVNAELLPGTGNSINLGASTNAWKDLYLDGAVYLDGIRFAGNTGSANTFLGSNSLINNTTGHDNTAVGNTALNLNTTGYYNTAFGTHALMSNTTAFYNTAVGFEALFSTSKGGSNTAVGMTALHDNTGSYNTAVGSSALYKNTTGFHNTAIGDFALLENTTGDYNSSLGSNALEYNTTGYQNTAAGYDALQYNTSGYLNTAYGSYSLQSNTTGVANSASGHNALNSNTTGSYNVTNGYKSLYSNTTGSANTAQGYRALFSNITGYSNVAIGVQALYKNTTQNNLVAIGDSALYNSNGAANTAIGSKALFSNTSGGYNTGTGNQVLYLNTTGNYNTATGRIVLYSNTSGSFNNAQGYRALYANTTGDYNTAIGYGAGSFNDASTTCTFLGNDADQAVSTDFSNSMALGNIARITGSNQVRIGNSAVTSIGGYANWTNISDERVKKNIKENVPGLEFINKLKPVTYNLNVTGIKSFLKEENNDDKTDQADKNANDKSNALIEQGIKEKEKIIYTGFVAQDVEAVAKKINYDFSGVDKPQDENGLYGLRYAEFVVPLVKAVQELSKKNDDLQKQIDELKSLLLTENNKTGSTEIINQQSVELNGEFSLSQNMPNPFTNSTQINYYLPVNSNNAYINFYAMNGALLKSIKLSGNGKGNISVKANEMPSGAYKYALMIDGKIMDSKSMIVSK